MAQVQAYSDDGGKGKIYLLKRNRFLSILFQTATAVEFILIKAGIKVRFRHRAVVSFECRSLWLHNVNNRRPPKHYKLAHINISPFLKAAFDKMRYIDVAGEVIPKHCIYGPRPAEGLVLTDFEWWRITNNLVKAQREKELAGVLKAKEEAKREISFNMTRNWSNTLASVKTQGNEKRLQKQEKLKQDRIDAYNEIIKTRKAEKKAVLADVKNALFQEKDAVKTANSAVLYSLVLDERRKQIEMKNYLKGEEEKKEQEWALKIRKEVEEYEAEKMEEKKREREKIKIQRSNLDKQVADIKRRMEAENDSASQKQDLINMKIEGEKIHKCNMVEKKYRKDFAVQYMRKTDEQIEYQRNLALEEEEENEINKIFNKYEEKFRKERREREEKIKSEEIERREKIAEMLSQKLQGVKEREEERHLSAVREKEERERQEEESREERKRKALEDSLEGKRKADERKARALYALKEHKKWNMMQQYRSAEVNEEWKESEKKRKQKEKEEFVKAIDLQCKELAEIREREMKEWLAPLEDESIEKEELMNYFQEVKDFAKKNNLPDYPIQAATSDLRKYGIFDEKKEELEQKKREKEEVAAAMNENKKQKFGSRAVGCYCFKY